MKEKIKEKTELRSKKEKGALRFIVSSVCLMASVVVAVTALSLTTDIFEKDNSVKAMVLSSLLPQDESQLESYLSKLSVLSELELNETTVSDEFYSYVKPQSKKGLYSSFGFSASLLKDTPDPAQRFENQEGGYSYYKLEKKNVDEIIKTFGLIPNHTLNCKDIYYFDGYYYFAEGEKENRDDNIVANIVSSNRIEDGSYYINCEFYNAESEGKKQGEIYAIVKKEQDANSKDIKWIFSLISEKPIFDSSGIMIESDREYKFEMKREYFEGTLSDGTVFCEYSIEYPYFNGDTPGENSANLLYNEVLSKYRKSAEEAEKYFKEYKGTKSQLPIVVHLSSEVTFDKNGKISTVVDISEYNKADLSKEEQNSQTVENTEELKSAMLAKRSIEGYVFDAETGEYISKDAVLGKNYQLIYDLLYRIQGDYTYDDLLDEEIPRPSDIPADDTIGKAIYESGGALTENGYVFCLVTNEGFVESVLLPNDLIEKIAEE